MSRRAGRRGWGAVGLSYRRAVNFNKTQAAGKESEQNGWSFILVSVRFFCAFFFFSSGKNWKLHKLIKPCLNGSTD